MCCNDNIVINQIDKSQDSIVINESLGFNNVVVNINPPTDLKTNPLLNFLNIISSNFDKFTDVANNVISNSSFYLNTQGMNDLSLISGLSAKWQETAFEVDTMQIGLTGIWDETYNEVNTIQDSLSAGWQETYNIVKTGVIDGGYF